MKLVGWFVVSAKVLDIVRQLGKACGCREEVVEEDLRFFFIFKNSQCIGCVDTEIVWVFINFARFEMLFK